MSVPPQLHLAEARSADVFCPFGLQSSVELRLSQKKQKRRRQEEKAQKQRLQLAINSELSNIEVGKATFLDLEHNQSLDGEQNVDELSVEGVRKLHDTNSSKNKKRDGAGYENTFDDSKNLKLKVEIEHDKDVIK